MLQSNSTDLYMNMQQFSEMKLGARKHSAEATKAAAQQFEGMFVQMMLKSMRAAAKVDDGQHSSNMDFYMDMYDKQMSMMLSQQGGIGIADVIEKQLGKYLPKGQEAAAETGKELPTYRVNVPQAVRLPMVDMNYIAANPQVQVHELRSSGQADNPEIKTQTASSLQSETLEPFYGWEKPESFVKDLWPHAEKAAQKLGVSASVLVAQSALETGWGKHAMKKPDGSIAFNLFGIKASHGWGGPSVLQNTLEFRDGAMQQEKAQFRAYDSASESLDDYVEFVLSNPRYEQALKHGGSDAAYIKSLHQAGYATDPQYADKILNIMSRPTFNNALASLQANGSTLSQGESHG